MENSADALLYWSNYLKGYTAISGIPFESRQPSPAGQEVTVETIQLPTETTEGLLAICDRNGISLTTFIQCAWGFLLARYNNTEDVVFGICEPQHEVMPLRVQFSPTETVSGFLKRLQQEALQRRHLHLADIQSQSILGNDLFNHVVTFDQPPHTAYRFQLIVSTTDANIVIRFDQQAYIHDLVRNIAVHLSVVIRQFIENEHLPLDNISYISDSERQKVLYSFNDTAADYPREQTITALFEEQVRKTPGNAAIVKEDRVITYEALNNISNQLAFYLSSKCGVMAGDTVAVKLERSEFLIIALLGILKADAIYLPMDKDIQEKRMEYIREDSQYKYVIDAASIEDFMQHRQCCPEENNPRRRNADDIAYIIYTSGTTGQPKGTLIRHYSLVNRLCWMQKQYRLTDQDNILQKTTCTFDVSVWELLWWSIAGAKVTLLKDGDEKDPEQIIHYIERYAITVLHFVPSMLSRFLDFAEGEPRLKHKLESLKRVYASGEALTAKLNLRFHRLLTGARLVNLYGPTEATIDVTCFECAPGLDVVPIGKPIDNTRTYILDSRLQAVPVGVEGNLFLAGAGLAAGYLNKPDLTAQRFIQDPFHPGERMYHTGDTAKWMPDGNIEYTGRNDDQIKLRGFRIEPGEISYHLERISGISAAHVLKTDEKLVAFLLSSTPQQGQLDAGQESSIRSALEKCVPDYMVPHRFLLVKEIPLSSSGKADKKQLISLYEASRAHVAAAKPAAATLSAKARDMAGIWAEVLNIPIDTIDPGKSFIEYGGDSLSMLRVVAICKKKGYPVTIKDFLRKPYLHILEDIGQSKTQEKSRIEDQPAGEQKNTFMLSPIQQFFFDHNKQELNFIMHASYYLHPLFNTDSIGQSIAALTANHDSFSLRFKKEKGMWVQYYAQGGTDHLLENCGPQDDTADLASSVNRALEIINIEKGPLLYARIFYEHARPVLFLACHHLVMDAVSWKIFIGELEVNYFNNHMPEITTRHKEADYANL